MIMKKLLSPGTLCAFLTLLSLTACEKDADSPLEQTDLAVSTANARRKGDEVTFYALTNGATLDKLSTKFSERVLGSASITGLQAGEIILAIDFRPATGQLYGLGSSSRLYVINPETGVARQIGPGAFAPALSGTIAGFDFNPTVDRIRVVTNTGQNLRLNPETGTVVMVDGPINGPAGATVAAVAYVNNVAGATTTTLFDIDLTTNKLYRQDPPNAGTLVEVGPLKLAISGEGGFDISPDGDALALFAVDKNKEKDKNQMSSLFSVDLGSGDTKVLAKYAKTYSAIAIPTRPVAYAVNAANNLLIFDPSHSDNRDGDGAVIAKPLMGLQPGEVVLGIDFRPLNGQLYALGSTGRIYTVNTASGAVAMVGTLNTPLNGTQFGFDFNPVVDRIRIVSNAGQNLRFNPNDGTTAIDMPLNPTTTGVTAAAYTNNFTGTTSTMLFDIDINTDKLYLQNPPNNGTLVEIGGLGVNVEAATGFDIGGFSGIAYALLTTNGRTKLYTINTATGKATAIDEFASAVNGLAIGLGF